MIPTNLQVLPSFSLAILFLEAAEVLEFEFYLRQISFQLIDLIQMLVYVLNAVAVFLWKQAEVLWIRWNPKLVVELIVGSCLVALVISQGVIPKISVAPDLWHGCIYLLGQIVRNRSIERERRRRVRILRDLLHFRHVDWDLLHSILPLLFLKELRENGVDVLLCHGLGSNQLLILL